MCVPKTTRFLRNLFFHHAEHPPSSTSTAPSATSGPFGEAFRNIISLPQLYRTQASVGSDFISYLSSLIHALALSSRSFHQKRHYNFRAVVLTVVCDDIFYLDRCTFSKKIREIYSFPHTYVLLR